METSAIALTDKVILELDSQVLSYVKLILLTVACEYTSHKCKLNSSIKKMNFQEHANGDERPSIISFRCRLRA